MEGEDLVIGLGMPHPECPTLRGNSNDQLVPETPGRVPQVRLLDNAKSL